MKEIYDPIKSILFYYCHVECFAVQKIHSDMKKPGWKLDTTNLGAQFVEMIRDPNEYISEVNRLTGNEFETGDALRDWLIKIWEIIDSSRNT